MKSTADLLPEVTEYCRQNGLLPTGGRIVVGISGGPDSLALLDLLHRMAPRHGFAVVAAHLNHGLRGDASDADEAAVRRICAGYGIPLHVRRHDVRAEADARCQGLEETGRRVRYAFFESIARIEYVAAMRERERNAGLGDCPPDPEERHVLYRSPEPMPAADIEPATDAPAAILAGGIRIAVGHHRNDQAETVLLNLGRGSGIDGLAGMRSQNGLIVRPLLDVPRSAIDAYLRWRGLEPCLDATNFDMEATRNRLRHRVLPALSEAFGFDAVTPLARAARLLRQDADYLQMQAESELARLQAGDSPASAEHPVAPAGQAPMAREQATQKLPGQVSALPVRDAPALHPAILGRVLRLWYHQSFGDVRDLAESQVASLVGLCATGRSGRRASLPNGRQAVRNFDWLILLAPQGESPGLLAPQGDAPGLLSPQGQSSGLPSAADDDGLQKVYETGAVRDASVATGFGGMSGGGADGRSDSGEAIGLQKFDGTVESRPGGVGQIGRMPRSIGENGAGTTVSPDVSQDGAIAVEGRPLLIPGTTAVPGGGRFVTQFIVDQAQIVYNDRTWCFTAPALAGAIVRHRLPHDYIHVEGSTRGKLLKKLFCERQVPAALRDRLPVIARDATVLWIPGVAASERLPSESGPAAIPPGQWLVVRYIRPEAAADGSQP